MTNQIGDRMLSESVAALAAAGGTAVVQAVGTDVWVTTREQVARLFSRGDGQRQTAELVRLDQTAHELGVAGQDDENSVVRWQSAWQARLEMFLDSLPEDEQAAAAEELLGLVVGVKGAVHPRSATAGDKGVAATGDVNVDAHDGSMAGGVVSVEGNVQLGVPFDPPSP